MSEQTYPDYVYRMLTEARALLAEDDFTGLDVAAICYDILALFPDCREASDLVLEAFNDPWVIRDNRKAIGRTIDEWDDRVWQQRQRLARRPGRQLELRLARSALALAAASSLPGFAADRRT